MNREDAAELLPIIHAFADGKEIQCHIHGNKWIVGDDMKFDGKPENYRIKPEPRIIYFNKEDGQVISAEEEIKVISPGFVKFQEVID